MGFENCSRRITCIAWKPNWFTGKTRRKLGYQEEDKNTKEIHKQHITLKGKITNNFRLCLVSKKCQEKLFSHAWFDYEKYQE